MTGLALIAHAPGRINLIGEHTDYNDGFVLPAAIDKRTTFRILLNGTEHTVNARAVNLNESHTFDLTQVEPIDGGWANYVMGVVGELQKLGAEIKGFDCEFEGDVPIGSGMSSSAALECSLAVGLNDLFELGFDKWQLIKASQKAEHNYVGIMSGIMDQFASMMGKADHAMLLDCRSLEFEYVPLELGNYELLFLNTNVSHSLGDSEYNTRRQACEEGVSIIQQTYPAIQSLRDVDMDMLHTVKTQLSDRVYRRCHHIIAENARVHQTKAALTAGDFAQVGKLIYASHDSLQHDYEVSCPELDYLVSMTRDKDYILGSRMMGGGFGGCTLNLIQQGTKEAFIAEVSPLYQEKFGIELTPIVVSIGDGAHVATS